MRIVRTQLGCSVLFGPSDGTVLEEMRSSIIDLSSDLDLVAGLEVVGILFCLRQGRATPHFPEHLPIGVEYHAREDILYISLNRDRAHTPFRSVHPPVIQCHTLLTDSNEIAGMSVRCPAQFDWGQMSKRGCR